MGIMGHLSLCLHTNILIGRAQSLSPNTGSPAHLNKEDTLCTKPIWGSADATQANNTLF